MLPEQSAMPSASPPHVPEARKGSSEHVAALDGIRGVAMLVVLVHNASYILGASSAFLPKLASAIAATGWLGVQLFFVLSGFLITGILIDSRGTHRFFRTFYIRRTLRIFPLYYAFLLMTFLLAPLVMDPLWIAAARKNQWWYWTYLSNWGSPFGHAVPGLSHFWSLAVEEQFYLVWPLLVCFLSGRRLIGVCVAIVVATPLIRYLLHVAGLPQLAAYEFTIARWDALALGAILAGLMRDESLRPWLQRGIPLVGAVAVTALGVFVGAHHGFQADDLAVQVFGQTLVAAISMWLIHSCVAPSSRFADRIRSLASVRSLRFLGKYSYAIYVFHFPIHRVASRYLTAAVNGADTNWRLLRLAAYVGCIVTLSVLGAMISWRMLERPFLDLKERYATRRSPSPENAALAAP